MNVNELFQQEGVGTEIKNTAPGLQIFGGAYGITPDFRNRLFWHNYVRRNTFTIVLETPGFFNYFKEAKILHGSLKSLMETGSKTIDGLRATLNAEYVGTEINRSGELWEDISIMKRERSEPVYGFVEKAGKPVNKLLDFWMRYGIMDPDLGVPLVSLMQGAEDYQLVSSNTSLTAIHIEADPTNRRPVEAYLNFNMQPKTAGAVESVKQLTTGQQILEYSVPFTSTQLYGGAVNTFAQDLLKELALTGLDLGKMALPLNKRSADVEAVTADGLKEAIKIIKDGQKA